MPDRLIRWISALRIVQGAKRGERFVVRPWQRRWIRGTWQPEIVTSALSVGRGAGKSSLCAAIAAASIAGPLRQPFSDTILVAPSFELARIAFRMGVAFLGPELAKNAGRFRVRDSHNCAEIERTDDRSRLRALASNSKRMHGQQAGLFILDECAGFHDGDRVKAAAETSAGKLPDTKILFTGTLPPVSDHWFAAMFGSDGEAADYAQLHQARPDDPPFQLATWRKANPSMTPELERVIRREARKARQSPAVLLPQFAALRLNAGVSDVAQSNLVMDLPTWERCEVEPAPVIEPGYVLGLDLAMGKSMDAIAAFDYRTGACDARAFVGAIPTLRERGRRDGVGNRYERMAARGELAQLGTGRTVPADLLIAEALRRWGTPSVITGDRYRESELRDALAKAGCTRPRLMLTGLGFRDGSLSLEAFRRAAADRRLKVPKSLLLRSCLSEAKTIFDAAGNVKLIRTGGGGGRRKRARDDALVALILAVWRGTEEARRPARRAPRIVGIAGGRQ